MTRPIITFVYNSCIHVVRSRLRLIEALQEAGYEVVVIAPTDQETPRLVEEGITHRPIDMSQYGMSPIADMRVMRQIREILEELRPFASLHYTIKANIWGSLSAHQARVPVFNNIAGAGRVFSGGNALVRWLALLLYRYGLRQSHTVFFQNADDLGLFLEAGLVREDQCVRIPGSGVDLARFKATELPRGPVRFLFVGRLLLEKGVVEYLDAANTLLAEAENPDDLRFDLVGELGEDRGFIQASELERLTQAEQVTYHGVVPPEQIDQMMRDTTCVVLPTYYGEGVPRVLLEACASGRPIITTDNVGSRDVVEPGKNGWMVAPRDVLGLAKAMSACSIAGPEELAELGRAARRIAEERFSEGLVIDAYLDRLRLLTK